MKRFIGHLQKTQTVDAVSTEFFFSFQYVTKSGKITMKDLENEISVPAINFSKYVLSTL